jgi:hypothetical protein
LPAQPLLDQAIVVVVDVLVAEDLQAVRARCQAEDIDSVVAGVGRLASGADIGLDLAAVLIEQAPLHLVDARGLAGTTDEVAAGWLLVPVQLDGEDGPLVVRDGEAARAREREHQEGRKHAVSRLAVS